MPSPAEVIRSLLVQRGVGVFPGIEQKTPFDITVQIHVGSMPDNINICLCVYDNAGIVESRNMWTGKIMEHPGIKIMARGERYQDNDIIYLAAKALDTMITGSEVKMRNKIVAQLHSVYRTSNVLHLGEEKGTRRHLWAFNARVAFRDPETTLLEE